MPFLFIYFLVSGRRNKGLAIEVRICIKIAARGKQVILNGVWWKHNRGKKGASIMFLSTLWEHGVNSISAAV